MDNARKMLLQKLDEKRLESESTLRRLMQEQREYADQRVGDAAADECDNAQREISVAGAYRLIEKKTGELKRINRLIHKITSDEAFGTCEECGRRIPPKRLLIMPDATLCVACQSRSEKFASMRNRPLNALGGMKASLATSTDPPEDLDGSDLGLTDLDMDMLPALEGDDPDTQGTSSGL